MLKYYSICKKSCFDEEIYLIHWRKNCIEGFFFLRLRETLDNKLSNLGKRIRYRNNKIDDKKLFVMSYDNQFTCNPRYIVEELLARKAPIKIVWVINKNKKITTPFPKQVTLVPRGTFEMFEEQGSAKVWLDNGLNCVWFDMPKKENQVYINTWHGSLGIKKLGGDDFWMSKAKRCNAVTDYLVTNSKFEEDVFKNSFWKDGKFLKYGHARNDLLLDAHKKAQLDENTRIALGLSKGTKIALYAPTFRDNGDTTAIQVNYPVLKKALEEKFGGNWEILMRLHFKNRSLALFNNPYPFVHDVTMYPEMQELLSIADIGITDYSSWAYDFLLTEKPLFILAKDIDMFNNLRGFYYHLDETPFPIAVTDSELIENIKDFNDADYRKKSLAFLEGKGCYEEGKAAKKIADKICEIMGVE